jgi:enoyl-[acyl-carrier protein] reductase III
MSELDGSWGLILGASGAFGSACARALAREGCNIFGVHLDTSEKMAQLDALVSELRGAGVDVEYANLNAASDAGIREGIELFAKRSGSRGKVRVLVHALAFGSLGPLVGRAAGQSIVTSRQLQMTLNVMANSLVYWVQALLERDLLARGAHVFALTSIGSTNVVPNYGAVSAAKAALEAHVRQLAFELAPYEIAVNAVRAGVTETEALLRIPGSAELIARAKQYNPYARLTRAEDVADSIALLCRSPHTWMTGNVIGVDGGEKLTL